MPRYIAILSLACGLLASFTSALAGDTPLTYDRISLSATATREVENDTLVAVLFAQREGNKTPRLTNEVNQTVAWGLEQVHGAPGVKVQTLEYYTTPVYSKQTLIGWRVRQSLRLESHDAGGLAQLIGTLQERLSVQSIGYQVSPERRAQVEEALIGEAIGAFSRRARLVAKQLGREDYRLVNMNLNSPPPIQPMGMRNRAMALEMSATPPSLEAGTQTLTVSVNGTIELQL